MNPEYIDFRGIRIFLNADLSSPDAVLATDGVNYLTVKDMNDILDSVILFADMKGLNNNYYKDIETVLKMMKVNLNKHGMNSLECSSYQLKCVVDVLAEMRISYEKDNNKKIHIKMLAEFCKAVIDGNVKR